MGYTDNSGANSPEKKCNDKPVFLNPTEAAERIYDYLSTLSAKLACCGEEGLPTEKRDAAISEIKALMLSVKSAAPQYFGEKGENALKGYINSALEALDYSREETLSRSLEAIEWLVTKYTGKIPLFAESSTDYILEHRNCRLQIYGSIIEAAIISDKIRADLENISKDMGSSADDKDSGLAEKRRDLKGVLSLARGEIRGFNTALIYTDTFNPPELAKKIEAVNIIVHKNQPEERPLQVAARICGNTTEAANETMELLSELKKTYGND